MINFSGVWDAQMKHRLVGFVGVIALMLVGYFAAVASGIPITIRFFL
jgi:hypothetical protein